MGAFGGFLGGLGAAAQSANSDEQQGAAGGQVQPGKKQQGGQAASAGGNQWSILPIIQKSMGIGSGAPGGKSGSGTPQQAPQNQHQVQPINTQTQQHGFNGLIPMAQNYYANHQAKGQDALAQTHIQSLQDPNTTPEQRQYHVNNLQKIYANRPDVLKQMGLPAPGAYNVPQVQGTASQSAASPAGGK